MGYIVKDSIVSIGANSKILEFEGHGIVSSFTFDSENNLYLGKRNSGAISFLRIKEPYKAADVTEIGNTHLYKRGITIKLIDSGLVYSDVRGDPNIPYSIKITDQKNNLIYSEELDFRGNTLYTYVIKVGNKIFLSTNKTLREIDLSKKTALFTEYESLIIGLSNVSGKVVAGLRLNGLSVYPHEEGNALANLPEKVSVSSALCDYEKGIWISSLEKGVFYLSPDPVTQLKTSEREGEYITCLAPFDEKKNKYIVGYNTGRLSIYQISPERSTFRDLLTGDKKEPGSIITFYKNKENSLLVSSASGTAELNAEGSKINSIKNSPFEPPRKIVKYKDSLLLLYIKHLKVYYKNSGKTRVLLTSKHRLNSVTYDSVNNKIYIGSLQGFYLYNNKPDIESCIKILSSRIQDAMVKGDEVYAASKNDGLIILGREKTDTLSLKKGLLSNICNAINRRGEEIWISSNKGLSKLKKTGKRYKITNFPISSFLNAPSVSGVQFIDDRIMFFSEDRIFTFSAKNSVSSGEVRISSITANKKLVSIQSPVVFKYNQTDIIINFEALFYDHGGLIVYRYKLGKEDEWHYTTQSSAHFPRLSYGNYNFILQACDRSGEWITASDPLHFKIKKPVWMNLWFIISLGIVMSLSAAVLIRFRFKTALKGEQEKNNLKISVYEMESRIAKAQMNPHFIFNALNSIQQFILGKDNESAYRYLSKFAKLIRMLLETNTSENILLDNEIDLIRRYIEIESLRFEDSFLYDLEVDPELYKKGIQIPHMLVQPFVENAIWHGLRKKRENKKLVITFRQHSEQTILCVVEDNGVGRDLQTSKKENESLNKKSLALELIKQRMDLLYKTKNIQCGFEISDKKDENNQPTGTHVRIIIPILKHEYTQSNNN